MSWYAKAAVGICLALAVISLGQAVISAQQTEHTVDDRMRALENANAAREAVVREFYQSGSPALRDRLTRTEGDVLAVKSELDIIKKLILALLALVTGKGTADHFTLRRIRSDQKIAVKSLTKCPMHERGCIELNKTESD